MPGTELGGRDFVKAAAGVATAAAALTGPARAFGRVIGANDRINVGLIVTRPIDKPKGVETCPLPCSPAPAA